MLVCVVGHQYQDIKMRLPVVQFDVLDVSVRNPVKVVANETYTTYEISVQTTDIAFSLSRSVTRRRFSEFVWLRKKLKDHHPQLNPPALPKKTFFGERFDPEFISVRMKNLEEFLVGCFKERLYFSDSSLHLFVQSRLTCEQIDEYLQGSLPEAQVEAARDKCHVRMRKSWYDESTEELTTDSHTDRRTDLNRMSSPCSIPSPHWEQFSEDMSSSSESISDSLGSDMYVSCAVGTGSIQ